MTKDELILKECKAYPFWDDLDELEQDDFIMSFGKIYDAGYKIKEQVALELKAESLVKVVRTHHSDICQGDPKNCEICAELEGWE